MAKSKNITVKNPSYMELPEISISMEMSGTTYRFTGLYDGDRPLPSKLLKMMANNLEEGRDKGENV